MARYVELHRHTDNDGDALTEEGVRAALEIGRELAGGYELLVSTVSPTPKRCPKNPPWRRVPTIDAVPSGARPHVREGGFSDVSAGVRARQPPR
jgi:hypothetical protein